MPFDIAKVEGFFEAQFEPQQDSSTEEPRYLHSFDGLLHWHLTLHEAQQFLQVTASKELPYHGLPSLELGVFYSNSDVRISSLMEGGAYLVCCPQGCSTGANLLVLTKALDGRISLCTTLGEPPEDTRDTLVKDWFEGRD